MDSVIEFRETCTESGSFDDVVTMAEQRIDALKYKGFVEAMAEITPTLKRIDTEEVTSWTVELRARKLAHG